MVDALWPATTAVVGVYEERPPEGSGITAYEVDEDDLAHDLTSRELVKTARAATRLKDFLTDLIG